MTWPCVATCCRCPALHRSDAARESLGRTEEEHDATRRSARRRDTTRGDKTRYNAPQSRVTHETTRKGESPTQPSSAPFRRANAAEERRASAESRRAELESALLELTGRLDTWKDRCEEQEQELEELKARAQPGETSKGDGDDGDEDEQSGVSRHDATAKGGETVSFLPPPLSQKEEEIAALRHQVEMVQAEYDDMLKSNQVHRKEIKSLRQKCHLARELLQRKDLEIESIREKAKRAEARARGELVMEKDASSVASSPSSSSLSSSSSYALSSAASAQTAPSSATSPPRAKGEKSEEATVMNTSLTPAETVSWVCLEGGGGEAERER